MSEDPTPTPSPVPDVLPATYVALRAGTLRPDTYRILCLLEDFDQRLKALEKKTKLPSP